MSSTAASSSSVAIPAPKPGVRRFVIVGTGGRSQMFIQPLAEKYRNDAQLVALCDPNPTRMAYYNDRMVNEWGYQALPTYHSDDFDRMIKETKPDVVIVCTVDALHHQYIIRAMELGCDVITEKPLTIDAEKTRAIYDTANKTGKKVRVTFNMRWAPGSIMIKELLSKGTIGEIIHVDLEYMLNTSHGADYFRRWHAQKDKSGGLMVHKSTHHFDMINWWIDAVPETIFGFGSLGFYGQANAEKRGQTVKGERYLGHDNTGDPFAFDINASDRDKALYANAEKHDNYYRDRNVFGKHITIEDSMSVLVKYRTNTTLNYSLNAYCPREGFHVAFNGTKGRLEYRVEYGSHTVEVEDNASALWQSQCIVHPMFGKAYTVEIPTVTGGHGGADPALQEQLFSKNPPADVNHGTAQHGQGAASALIGIAANMAFETGKPQHISELCPQMGKAVHLHELP